MSKFKVPHNNCSTAPILFCWGWTTVSMGKEVRGRKLERMENVTKENKIKKRYVLFYESLRERREKIKESNEYLLDCI